MHIDYSWETYYISLFRKVRIDWEECCIWITFCPWVMIFPVPVSSIVNYLMHIIFLLLVSKMLLTESKDDWCQQSVKIYECIMFLDIKLDLRFFFCLFFFFGLLYIKSIDTSCPWPHPSLRIACWISPSCLESSYQTFLPPPPHKRPS